MLVTRRKGQKRGKRGVMKIVDYCTKDSLNIRSLFFYKGLQQQIMLCLIIYMYCCQLGETFTT